MIGAIILGLLAGYIAKALVPGPDPGGFIVTILLGLAGSLVGFFLFTEVLGIGDTQAFDLGGLVGAIIGTVLLLVAYRSIVGAAAPRRDGAARRTRGVQASPGPGARTNVTERRQNGRATQPQ